MSYSHSNPTLYIVSTPIGNLSDFSVRAQEVLKAVSFILCEDTRHTLKLLNHFGIQNQLESLHIHNEKNKIQFLMDKIINSPTKSAALVSDAGTPAICDPGSYLIAAAHEKNIKIQIIPGPSSMSAALAASGFIQPRTLFSGFLPKQSSDQFAEFKLWANTSPCIAIFFESPRRILTSLKNLSHFLTTEFKTLDINAIEICVSREISKKFEEHKRLSLTTAIAYYETQAEILGEFVVTVNLNKLTTVDNVTIDFVAKEALLMSKLHKIPLKICCKDLAKKYNLNPKDIYALTSNKDTDILYDFQ